MATPRKPKRLYQVWQGSNRFFCGGRLIFGPEVGSIFLTTSLIAAPVVLFCFRLLSRIHNHDSIPLLSVLFVAIVVTILDLIFLFLTSNGDPGIMPRNKQPVDLEGSFNTSTQSMEWVHTRTPQLRLARTRDVIVNGNSVKVKYCDTCFLYRPPRASHCSICDNCIQRFDHHCPWVGQCIGVRNYRFFFLFISSSTFLCIYVFIFSWVDILAHKDDGASLKEVMSKEVLSLILIIYCFVVVWFVGGLTVFHIYLISTNQTTYENFKYQDAKKENPYKRVMLRNFKELFFSKIPPSMNDFRSWVAEDHTEGQAVSPSRMGDSIYFKDENGRTNIKMGSSWHTVDDHSLSTTKILKNVSCKSFDDYMNSKTENQDGSVVPFPFPIDQQLTDTSQNCATLDDNELKDSD